MRRSSRYLSATAGLVLPWLLVGCQEPPPPPEPDNDADGFSVSQGDCSDFDPNRFPGATETCNRVDDNCDGKVDEPFDRDQDGASSCTQGGDCNDTDPAAFPGNDERSDGIDNDCNGIIDDRLVDFDDDGDGFCEIAPCTNTIPADRGGDCDDEDSKGSSTANLVNPAAIEVEGDKVDNDCDGDIDEPVGPCDDNTNPGDPLNFAKAMGFCSGEVVSATFIGPSNPNARAIADGFGPISPTEGTQFIHLSSGNADEDSHSGTQFGNTFPHPNPITQADIPASNTCAEPDEAEVNDYTELELIVNVPTNAQSFSYRFQFFSFEYVTFRCTQFDDTFLALMESDAFTGNISFDAQGNVVSINNGFFQICDDDDIENPNANPLDSDPNNNICLIGTSPALNGTGYEGHGATLPLTTTAPVVPGETIVLRFIIFDEGDANLDSSVIIDNFKWLAEPADDEPVTQP